MRNRFEEYLNFKDNIPFVLHRNLRRTQLLKSCEANWHDNIELQFVDSGNGSVLVNGRSFSLAEGDVIVINSGLIHHTGTDSSLEYSCIIIDVAFCRDAGIDPEQITWQTHVKDNALFEILSEICRIYENETEPCRVAKLRRLTLSLLILLCEHYQTEKKKINQNETVKRALRYLKEHFQSKISLDEMAGALYINKYVLSRQFKEVIGMTLFEYLNSYRCNTAAGLIMQGMQVSEAARECGFENMSFFSKTFKSYMGILPSAYKKRS